MKSLLSFLMMTFFLSGCATSGSKHYQSFVNKEVDRLPLPTEPISSYDKFELKDMVIEEQITQRGEKLKVALTLEDKIKDKLIPLIKKWNQKNRGLNRKLIITPQLQELHVVSAESRFFMGGMLGDSRIDMDLKISEEETGKIIAIPRIVVIANATAGMWSLGATDQNLLNYVADISKEYIEENYYDGDKDYVNEEDNSSLQSEAISKDDGKSDYEPIKIKANSAKVEDKNSFSRKVEDKNSFARFKNGDVVIVELNNGFQKKIVVTSSSADVLRGVDFDNRNALEMFFAKEVKGVTFY